MELVQHTQITIESLPPMRVGCYRSISAEPENDGAVFMAAWLAAHGLPADTRRFGFDIDVPAEASQAGQRGYAYWAVLPEGAPAGDGLTLEEFPGGLYAVTTLLRPFAAPFEQIPNGWKLLHEWVIGSAQYQGGLHQWLEEMFETPDGGDLKLYHPVMPKKTAG